MYSENGVDWIISQTIAFSAEVEFTDGATLSFARREDPKLVFNQCGYIVGLLTPVQLCGCGAQGGDYCGCDHSYLLGQPVAHKPCDHRED